jgi:adenylate cyclase class 2
MAREIELKVSINLEYLTQLRDWLQKNAKFIGEETHLEYYFDNPQNSWKFNHPLLNIIDSENYLRVRKTEKASSVCLKVFKIDRETGKAENLDEIEYDVSDFGEAVKLFESLGYTDKTIIDKKREKYDSEKFEIVIDDVKGLGIFVEVELKEQIDGDIKIGFNKIKDFLKSIGIEEFQVQKRGYISMLWNPEIDFGAMDV